MLNYCSQRTAECFAFLHHLHLLVNLTFTGKMSNTEFFFFFLQRSLYKLHNYVNTYIRNPNLTHAFVRRLTFPAQTRFLSLRLVNQVMQQHSCVSPMTHCVACYGFEVCCGTVHESRQTASVEHMLPGGRETYVRVWGFLL